MSHTITSHTITTLEELALHYPLPPVHRSVVKELDYLIPEYRALIEASPFVVLATSGAEGLDCSPRGDPAGFVTVADERTLILPDRRGNNRLDSLKNIIQDPRVALLFLVPGKGETMRVNGRAVISVDEELRARFVMDNKMPASVLVVHIERCYFQCQKALHRSKLWEGRTRPDLPTAGDMAKRVEPDFDAATYDANYPQHMKNTIY
jgi:uncharacterized protein